MDGFLDDFLEGSIDEGSYQALRQEMTGRFARYEEMIAVLLERTEQLEDYERKEELKDKLWRQRHRLKQGPVRLLVLGASSAGKSTLVNALAGKVVSPEGKYNTTCVPAWIVGVDALELGSEGPVYYKLKYSDEKGTYLPRENYLITFCNAPAKSAEIEKEYIAVYVKNVGGFLEESGITLLDTPGVSQKDEYTRMAIETAALGAELLLLTIRNNVFDTQEIEIYSELFPGGKYDLGLSPPDEVFCVFNEEPLASMPYNVVDSFRNLTVNQSLEDQVDTERRLYTVNVLTERRKHEAYLYSRWAPQNVTKEDDAYLKKMEKAERYGESILDTRGGEDYLKGHKQLTGMSSSESMRRLMDDLKLQAQAIYADPERVCGPIETKLRSAAEVLLKDCECRIRELTEQTGEEVADIPGMELTSPELDKHREILGELSKLIHFRIASFTDIVDGVLRDLKNSAATIRRSSKVFSDKIAEACFAEVPLDDAAMSGENWSANIVQPTYESFIQHLGEWQKKLSDHEPMEKISGWMGRDNMRRRLEEIFSSYNDLVKETRQFVPDIDASPYKAELEAKKWVDRFVEDAGGCLATEQTIQGDAEYVALKMAGIMNDLHTAGKNINGVFAGVRKRFHLFGASMKIHSLVRFGLFSAVERDLGSYGDCLNKHSQEFEQGPAAGLRGKLQGFADRLGELHLRLLEQQKILEEHVRNELLQKLLRERGIMLLQEEKEELRSLIAELVFSEQES